MRDEILYKRREYQDFLDQKVYDEAYPEERMKRMEYWIRDEQY